MTTAKKPKHKPRRAFRAWLIYELKQRGEALPDDPSYVQIKAALERQFGSHA